MPVSTQPRIVIAGAGIGGLACALAVHASNFRDITVLEAAPAIQRLGVGINIQPAAVAELTLVGLGDELERSGIRTRAMSYRDQYGNEVGNEPRGVAAGQRFPQYSLHRGDLHGMLVEAVRDRLGPDSIREGARVGSFVDDGKEVTARLAGPGAAMTHVAGDILIGADGVHSMIRRQLHPDRMDIRSSHVQMFRGVTEVDRFLDGETMIVANDKDKRRLIAYPISAAHRARGTALVNWVCLVPEEILPGGVPDTLDGKGSGAEVRDQYRDWRMDDVDVAALIDGSASVLRQTMVDRPPLDQWGSGRVTLLGDAAHLMYPVGAHGGSQAIVDGFVLAESLASSLSPVEALRSYEARRLPATGSIVQANRDRDGAERALAERTVIEKAAAMRQITRTYNAVTEGSEERR